MNYDDIVIGVENRNHPANQEEIIEFSELEEANQNTWKEKCAKWRLEEKIKNAEELLNELLDYSTTQNKTYVKNKVTQILKTLK
jgi:primase-polymerase (primpol)-like protein